MSDHKNGCWNRLPFVAEHQLSNGKMLPNFSVGKPCEYTKSELGQADKSCNGCLWKKLK